MKKKNIPLNLKTFDDFSKHPWIVDLIHYKYSKSKILAQCALERILNDLEQINKEYLAENKRVAFTTIEGRVKDDVSFANKLYKLCKVESKKRGITKKSLDTLFVKINDICGIRFSCPYFDEVINVIKNIVRPKLNLLGYATEINDGNKFQDSDLLDKGDELGYRSYHFFVKIPTPTDIYGDVVLCLCEIQARSELQHVWAVKSHDLLYKPKTGWDFSDKHVCEDMRQLSNNLRAADQSLISIRDRVRSGSPLT